ncbi:MAG: DUF3857 domain-containing protein [Chryseosolibacter sp.]
MKTCLLALLFFCIVVLSSHSQDFAFGGITASELSMVVYDRDTSASAVVLREFGHAFISGNDYHLIFKHHVRIKVLKKNGLSISNIEIPLHKQGSNRIEKIIEIKASSFNLENNRMREESINPREVFTEERSQYLDVKKFAIPKVRVGTIIEYTYTMTSPFVFNFREWEFQSGIPKVESEYWASLPGIYQYNITLRGFQELSRNESKIIKNCLGGGDPRAGGFSADCSLMQFEMKDIPAFVEEDYMTARKNFLSAINFELSEVRHPDGRIDKVTKEWKDAEQELRQESRFGVQLRKGRDIADEVKKLLEGEADDLNRAKKVYDFIKGWYVWNDYYGKYSEYGIRKAFDERKGNVGDINLSLIAALRFAGLDVEPVILSTRQNGSVQEIHPVLSEFNYVVAKVNIGDKHYLADATEKFHPFGMLPERCLNGKGRAIGEKSSYWIDLKPAVTEKTTSVFALTLGEDGVMRGTIHATYDGYAAVDKREVLAGVSQEEYIKDLGKSFGSVSVTGYEFKDIENLDKPLGVRLDVEISVFDNFEAANFLFNPFFFEKWSENPFKSKERLYPVDFGTPVERLTVFTLEYPATLEIVNIPEKVGLALPDQGGRFIFEARNTGNRLSFNNSLSIRKAVYTSAEYHVLKELFARILQVQQSELIFKRKS